MPRRRGEPLPPGFAILTPVGEWYAGKSGGGETFYAEKVVDAAIYDLEQSAFECAEWLSGGDPERRHEVIEVDREAVFAHA